MVLKFNHFKSCIGAVPHEDYATYSHIFNTVTFNWVYYIRYFLIHFTCENRFLKNCACQIGRCNYTQLLTTVCDWLGNVTFRSLPLLYEWYNADNLSFMHTFSPQCISNIILCESKRSLQNSWDSIRAFRMKLWTHGCAYVYFWLIISFMCFIKLLTL